MQYTENLNLAKYETNDVTSYLEVANANMTKIDAGHGTLNAQVTANTTAIGDVQDDVNDMTPQVADANTKANAGLSNTASVYDPSQTYAVGDYTLYNNNLYRCVVPIPQAESFDGTKWSRVKMTDEIKSCNGEITQIKSELSVSYVSLANGVTLTRCGNMRVLDFADVNDAIINSLPHLSAVDRPNHSIFTTALRLFSGAYGCIAFVGIDTNGTILCQYVTAYNNNAPFASFNGELAGQIVWFV